MSASPTPTQENKLKLARARVQDMELETLMDFAEDGLIACYDQDEKSFQDDWQFEFGEE